MKKVYKVLVPQAAVNGCGSTAVGDDVAISVHNVGKMYYLYDRPQDRLKQAFWGEDSTPATSLERSKNDDGNRNCG